MTDESWELRSALRWGSRHVGVYPTRLAAVGEATCRIAAAGGKGRITCIDDEKRIVYFDEHEEDS